MSNRDIIFGKIAKGLDTERRDTQRATTVQTRLASHLRHPTPGRVAGHSHSDHIALFKVHMTGQSATIIDVASMAEVPTQIATYLRQHNLPARIVRGTDATLADLPWAVEPGLTLQTGRATPDDEVGLSHATAGIAETGTLMIASGADNPVTINFLPETHIVVLEANDVVGPYEDAWMKIRARFGHGQMPRTVNMISGPSRTGDIGGKLVMGAHGPRRMCVIIVG
jgi:L-lactate dehydrogenase complex protein LldG